MYVILAYLLLLFGINWHLPDFLSYLFVSLMPSLLCAVHNLSLFYSCLANSTSFPSTHLVLYLSFFSIHYLTFCISFYLPLGKQFFTFSLFHLIQNVLCYPVFSVLYPIFLYQTPFPTSLLMPPNLLCHKFLSYICTFTSIFLL